MLKKLILFLLALFFLGQTAFCQFKLGGTCGAGITNNYLTVDVAPEGTYTWWDHLTVGGAPFFLYNSHLSSNYWSKKYGGRIFAQYRFDFNIFVHAEYEIANVSFSEGSKATVQAFPIGIGGFTDITSRMEAYALILYDIMYDEAWATRTNPMYRVGVRYKF